MPKFTVRVDLSSEQAPYDWLPTWTAYVYYAVPGDRWVFQGSGEGSSKVAAVKGAVASTRWRRHLRGK